MAGPRSARIAPGAGVSGRALALLACVGGWASGALACAGLEGRCSVETGSYHILLPPDATGPVPAVMMLHGYGADGLAMLRHDQVAPPLLARGYAVIAPNGRDRDGSDGGRWSFHPERPQLRDEAAFLSAVRADAAARFGIDAERTVLSGYSIGGSMTAYLACADPEAFPAYLPVAGGFWRPHPESCAGPVRLLHMHGWRDGTVPLEGRPLGGGRIVQGDIFAMLEILRRANGCDGLRATDFDTGAAFWRRRWGTCAAGALELVLHPGGHVIPEGWAALAVDWLEAQE